MLTADRNTPYTDGKLIHVPMAAGAHIFAGAIVCSNATGFAVKGQTATTLTYIGRADAEVNNTGADGEFSIPVRRKKSFQYKNSGADPVTQAEFGKTCFIEDDETLAKTNGGNTRSVAGIVLGVDSSGVWIE